MTQDTIDRIAAELKDRYPGTVWAKDGGLTLVRLPGVYFPPGCEPASSTALLVLDPAKPKPDFYVKVVPSMRGGQPSHGTAVVGGDSWCTFSYNLRWHEDHTGTQFLEGMLRRFA